MICFPLPADAARDPRALFATLLQRGFARVKAGDQVLDLAEVQGRPGALPAGLDLARPAVVLDRVVVGPDSRRRITDSLETALAEGEGRASVDLLERGVVPVSRDFHCPACGVALSRPQPLLFSFNHPLGACPECKGFGNVLRYDEARVVPDQTLSLAGGAVEPWSHPSGRWYQKQLLKAAKKRGVDTTVPYSELPAEDRHWVYDGGAGLTGIRGFFEEVESYRYKLHVRVFLSRYRSQSPCPRCEGRRLRRLPRPRGPVPEEGVRRGARHREGSGPGLGRGPGGVPPGLPCAGHVQAGGALLLLAVPDRPQPLPRSAEASEGTNPREPGGAGGRRNHPRREAPRRPGAPRVRLRDDPMRPAQPVRPGG